MAFTCIAESSDSQPIMACKAYIFVINLAPGQTVVRSTRTLRKASFLSVCWTTISRVKRGSGPRRVDLRGKRPRLALTSDNTRDPRDLTVVCLREVVLYV